MITAHRLRARRTEHDMIGIGHSTFRLAEGEFWQFVGRPPAHRYSGSPTRSMAYHLVTLASAADTREVHGLGSTPGR